MKRTVRKFSSFRERDRANRDYYLSLTPEQRIDILLELVERYRNEYDEAPEGFKRVCRIIKLRGH